VAQTVWGWWDHCPTGVPELWGYGMVGWVHWGGMRSDRRISEVFSKSNDSEARWGWLEPFRPPAPTPAVGWLPADEAAQRPLWPLAPPGMGYPQVLYVMVGGTVVYGIPTALCASCGMRA